MAIADARGTPIAIGIASGPRHEAKLVEETLSRRFVRGRLLRLIGDKAYDSAPLAASLKRTGTQLIAPLRKGGKRQGGTRTRKADGRSLRRYRRRWLVERVFAWLMKSRRLVTRYEHKAKNFLGFLELACAVILLRRF
jgi:transposase